MFLASLINIEGSKTQGSSFARHQLGSGSEVWEGVGKGEDINHPIVSLATSTTCARCQPAVHPSCALPIGEEHGNAWKGQRGQERGSEAARRSWIRLSR